MLVFQYRIISGDFELRLGVTPDCRMATALSFGTLSAPVVRTADSPLCDRVTHFPIRLEQRSTNARKIYHGMMSYAAGRWVKPT